MSFVIRNIDAPIGSTVLINIIGPSVTISGGAMLLAGVDREHLVLNFPQTTSIVSTDFDYQGTVLAPLASAVFDGGILTGNGIFGGDVNQGGGFELHNFSFRGNLPVLPVPSGGTIPGPGESVPQAFPPQLGVPIGPIQFPSNATPIPGSDVISKRMLLTSNPMVESRTTRVTAEFPYTAAWMGYSGPLK